MSYLVLDLEMTGFEPGWHEIIQIGACLYDHNWQEKGQYLQNVYPQNEESFSIPALEVHGLSMADLDDAPLIHDVLPEFEDWIIQTLGHSASRLSGREKHNILKKTIICGQSVINDINFLKFAYRDEHLNWPYGRTLLDLHTLTYFVFPVLRKAGLTPPSSRSLGAVAEFFGFTREGETHNALEDAVLTGKCFERLFLYQTQMELHLNG